MAAEHDASRVEHVDESGEPDPEPPADLAERGERRGVAGGGVGDDRIDGRPAAVDGPAGPRQQRLLADLGLPAADRTAPARARRTPGSRACARPRRRSRRSRSAAGRRR